MKEESVTGDAARRFLLGDVDDLERQRIERLFISEPEINTRILITEDDLIEEYLENSLAPSDREKFLNQYGYTAAERRRLRIAKSIKEFAVAQGRLTQTSPAISKWRTVLSSLRPRHPLLLIPVAAVLTVAFFVAVVWLVQLNGRRAQENARRLAIERELVALNARPGSTENSSQVLSLVLPPVSIRSVGPQARLPGRTDVRVIELHLLWSQKEQYPSYQAAVRRVGSSDEFRITDLHVENSPDGTAVRVRISTHLLKDGLYQAILTGVSADGAPATSEEYCFIVGG